MAENIDLVINGIDNATREIKNVTNSVNQLGGTVQDSRLTFTEFNSVVDLAKQGIQLLEQAYQAVIVPTIEYANTVREVMYLSGQSAEESSRLIQVLDDFKVSTSALEMAQKSLSKKGLSLTIETIADLSDQYIELGNDADRTAFLIDKFGKSGLQMAELMRQGSQAILDANDAIDENNILNREAVDASREYEKTLDKLNDTQQGLVMVVGQKVIPIIERNLSGFQSWIEAVQIATEKGNIYNTFWEFLNLRVEDNTRRMIEAENNTLLAGDAMETAAAQAEKLKEAEKAAADAAKAMSAANMGLYSTIMDVQKENDNYAIKLNDLQIKERELNGELNTLIAQGWSPTSAKVQEVTGKINDNKTAISDLEREHSRAMSLMTYNLFIAKLQTDGFTDAEFNLALQAGLTAGVLDQASVDMALSMNATAAAAAGESASIDGIKKSVDSLESKEITITTRYVSVGGKTSGHEDTGIGGYANGGYASGLALVGERGPELVSLPSGSYVHTNSESKKMMSGGGITLVYSPMISLASQAEAENVLLPMMRKLQRQLG